MTAITKDEAITKLRDAATLILDNPAPTPMMRATDFDAAWERHKAAKGAIRSALAATEHITEAAATQAARTPAAPVVEEGLASTALRKLCEQLDGEKRRMRHTPGTGQNHSYMLCEDVDAHVEEARKALQPTTLLSKIEAAIPSLYGMWHKQLIANGAVMSDKSTPARCEECLGTGKCGPDEDPNEMDCEVCDGSGHQVAAHPVAGSPAEAEYHDGLNVEEVLRAKRKARAAEPMPASEAPIGAGDPMAFFADFCDREGYPSDGEMDAALQGAFYEGIRYCAVHTHAAAPVPASEAASVALAALRQAERAFSNYDRHQEDVDAMAAIRAALVILTATAAPTDARFDNVWNDALEEAALAAEDTDIVTQNWCGQTGDDGSQTRSDIADAIRALKSSPQAPKTEGES